MSHSSLPRNRHGERHAVQHVGWLRAAILGANDGLLSLSSLLVGIANAGSNHSTLVVSGSVGLVAGALSMAAGEYVSVSSQADLEAADLTREAAELEANPSAEHRELAGIYMERGVSADTAHAVAHELMEHDALGAHAQDELGLAAWNSARPLQAAGTSAFSFGAGAVVPLLIAIFSPARAITPFVVSATLLCLVLLGAIGARLGRAPVLRAIIRISLLGGIALAVTILLGHAFGVAVG